MIEPFVVSLHDGRSARICPGQPALDQFLAFFNGLSTVSRDFMHGWAEADNLQMAQTFVTNTASNDRCSLQALTLEEPEQLVGFCWIDGLQSMEIPMLGIGIIDAYQEVGLGKALLRAMLDYARRLWIPRVQLGVFADNTRARHVYAAIGFHPDPKLLPKVFFDRTEIYLVAETNADE